MKLDSKNFNRLLGFAIGIGLFSGGIFYLYDAAWFHFIFPPSADSVSFQMVYDRVISRRCTGCHSVNFGGTAGDINLDTYAAVKENQKWIRTVAIELKKMPPDGALNPAEIKLLRIWLDAGAPEYPKSSQK